VITDNEAFLFTDDDYFLQAEQELDQTCWKSCLLDCRQKSNQIVGR
jgi:hypothetical protein